MKEALINRLHCRVSVTFTGSFTMVFPFRSCTAVNVSHSVVTFLVFVKGHVPLCGIDPPLLNKTQKYPNSVGQSLK